MATYAQLQAEPWWDREIITAELDWLGDELCRRTGQPAYAYGTKGNNAHLRGSHRSQEWLKNSVYATSRTYTVQSGLTTLQARYIGGVDWTPGVWGTAENRRRMIEITGRVIAEMKAGRLPEVREVYGTLDARTVTGWNNVEDRVATSDDSHLDHLHLGIDRRHANNRALMERLADLIGGDMYTQDDRDVAWATTNRSLALLNNSPTVTFTVDGKSRTEVNRVAETLAKQGAALAKLETAAAAQMAAIEALATAGGADAAPIVAAVDRVGAELGAELGAARNQITALQADLDAAQAREAELQRQLAAAHAAAAAE